MNPHSLRGTGRTTTQIKNALIGAVYIWPVYASINYPKEIARRLGRDDLRVVPLSWLHTDGYLKIEYSEIVLDHAASARASMREWKIIEIARERAKGENYEAERRYLQR